MLLARRSRGTPGTIHRQLRRHHHHQSRKWSSLRMHIHRAERGQRLPRAASSQPAMFARCKRDYHVPARTPRGVHDRGCNSARMMPGCNCRHWSRKASSDVVAKWQRRNVLDRTGCKDLADRICEFERYRHPLAENARVVVELVSERMSFSTTVMSASPLLMSMMRGLGTSRPG